MLCECQMADSVTAGQWSCALKSCTCTDIGEIEAALSDNVESSYDQMWPVAADEAKLCFCVHE